MAEVLGSMLTGVAFCCWIFLFPHSKASDVKIAIIANFCVFVEKKNSNNHNNAWDSKANAFIKCMTHLAIIATNKIFVQ